MRQKPQIAKPQYKVGPVSTSAHEVTKGTRESRFSRLLWFIREIRNDPRQPLKTLLARANISKSQFYKDKDELAGLGFIIEYKTNQGFQIIEDRISPLIDLTLSDRILLMFALRNLYSCGDGHLVARALETGKKLASGLSEPFKSHVLEEFEYTVIHYGYGCDPHILNQLENFILERRRIKIKYDSKHSAQIAWQELDPLRIYFLHRALYLYAYLPHKNPHFRTYRINRIKEISPTGIYLPPKTKVDNFYQEMNNAFIHFMGSQAHKVQIRFWGRAKEYVQETLWHQSQKIVEETEVSILFEVKVAEPKEVLWWAFQFAEEAEILEPQWLRAEAMDKIGKMQQIYQN